MFDFFRNKQKQIANKNSKEYLYNEYEKSENLLKDAALIGNKKLLRSAMAHYRDLKYAMLYQNTPQFNKLQEQNIKDEKIYNNYKNYKKK